MKQFGGKVTKALEKEYAKSPYWKNGKFENLVETKMDINFHNLPKLLYKQFFKTMDRMPNHPIPILNFDQNEFLKSSSVTKMIWYGHSVVLLRMNNTTILIDPMLGSDASPIGPFVTKRFSENSLDIIDQLPNLDMVLISHDHYDHLDLESIKKLQGKTQRFLVALGVKRHLLKWGVDGNKIQEFDWWDQTEINDIKISFTPTRHFSGRGLTDRAKSLWGGWTLKSTTENIWFSGDGGYGEHFKEIGKRLGPFDLAFMECGQYNENWHAIHMYPEESVQAALDAQVKRALPVHWAGFALAQHHWKEPVERFELEAKKQNFDVLTPALGEMFEKDCDSMKWWKSME